MSFAQLARSLFLLTLAVKASPALSLAKLQLQPVALLGYAEDDSLRISVEVPCGARYYGLVAQADGRTNTLRIAAAVVQEGFICTAMPDPVEVRVDYLATTRFRAIEPLAVADGTRLAIDRIQDLRLAAAAGGRAARLTAVYEPRCGRELGALIHQAGPARLELAFVERLGSGAPGACTIGTRTRQVTAVDLSAHLAVAPLTDKPKTLGRVYSLHLAAVRTGSVRRLAGGGVAVDYRRACNEAPVGLVLGQPRHGQAAVGVLVARYDNFACNDATGDWTTLTEASVDLPPALRALPLPPSRDLDGRELTFRQPTRLTRGADAGLLKIGYLGGCGDAYGVYSHDARGALAVGILTGGECKTVSGEVSLSQPYVAMRVPAGELYSMKLKGGNPY